MVESELLFTHILDCDRVSLYLNKDTLLTSNQSELISGSLKRRIKGEPLQYIIGKAEFMGFEFKVNPDVLIPRPETEILVEAALRLARGLGLKALNILDMGTGSGCIAVSLAKNLEGAQITAVDISMRALKTAAKNAQLNKAEVNFIQSDLFSNKALKVKSYDLIVSNPPYIVSKDIGYLQPELRYEPVAALDGGIDGLEFYREMIKKAPVYLKDGGMLLMEMGFNQRNDIEGLFAGSDYFDIIEVIKDYNNIDRVIAAKKGRRDG
jgi:release factor glutamine methyltransferase